MQNVHKQTQNNETFDTKWWHIPLNRINKVLSNLIVSLNLGGPIKNWGWGFHLSLPKVPFICPWTWTTDNEGHGLLTGTTSDVTPLARPVSTLPAYSIHTFCAAMMMVKPKTNGSEQNIRVSFLPIFSTIQPPSRPPTAAPTVTMDW